MGSSSEARVRRAISPFTDAPLQQQARARLRRSGSRASYGRRVGLPRQFKLRCQSERAHVPSRHTPLSHFLVSLQASALAVSHLRRAHVVAAIAVQALSGITGAHHIPRSTVPHRSPLPAAGCRCGRSKSPDPARRRSRRSRPIECRCLRSERRRARARRTPWRTARSGWRHRTAARCCSDRDPARARLPAPTDTRRRLRARIDRAGTPPSLANHSLQPLASNPSPELQPIQIR